MTTVVLGGGTFSDAAPHLSLCTRAFGTTAKQISNELTNLDVNTRLVLTKMADPSSGLITNKDVSEFMDELLLDMSIKAIVFNVAMCDFHADFKNNEGAFRLKSNRTYDMRLIPETEKVIQKIKTRRPDIYLVSFKTTASAAPFEQIIAAKAQLNLCSSDLVLANDIVTRQNILVEPTILTMSNRNELLNKIANRINDVCYLLKPSYPTGRKDYLAQNEHTTSIQD